MVVQKEMTVKEALQETLKTLNGISIPISMFQQVSVPIMQSVSNIEGCIAAMDDAEKENQKLEDKEPTEMSAEDVGIASIGIETAREKPTEMSAEDVGIASIGIETAREEPTI